METFTLPLPRWPRRPDGRRRPPPRGTERADRVALTVAVIIALLAVPVAAAVGIAVYDARLKAYAEQARNRHSVTATVTEETIAADMRRNTISAGVQWFWAGREHTDAVRVSPTVKPGDSVQIWVDQDGALTPHPLQRAGRYWTHGQSRFCCGLPSRPGPPGSPRGFGRFTAELRDAAWQRDIERLLGD